MTPIASTTARCVTARVAGGTLAAWTCRAKMAEISGTAVMTFPQPTALFTRPLHFLRAT
jgi:hypothetical protein